MIVTVCFVAEVPDEAQVAKEEAAIRKEMSLYMAEYTRKAVDVHNDLLAQEGKSGNINSFSATEHIRATLELSIMHNQLFTLANLSFSRRKRQAYTIIFVVVESNKLSAASGAGVYSGNAAVVELLRGHRDELGRFSKRIKKLAESYPDELQSVDYDDGGAMSDILESIRSLKKRD